MKLSAVPHVWRGLNRLGQTLQTVRQPLRDHAPSPYFFQAGQFACAESMSHIWRQPFLSVELFDRYHRRRPRGPYIRPFLPNVPLDHSGEVFN